MERAQLSSPITCSCGSKSAPSAQWCSAVWAGAFHSVPTPASGDTEWNAVSRPPAGMQPRFESRIVRRSHISNIPNLSVIVLKIRVFWNVTLCRCVGSYRRFERWRWWSYDRSRQQNCLTRFTAVTTSRPIPSTFAFICSAHRCATNRSVAGSIPDGVIGIFHWHNPSDRTMTLGSSQPLTEMFTRSIFWR